MRIRALAGLTRLTIALGCGLGICVHPATAQDRPLSADLPEVYRAGGMNAPEWAFFQGPSRADFDGAGNLYVLDTSADRVVVIDPEGRLVHIVGRPGEGPGELNRPMNLAVWRDGRFAVFNLGHTAYQLFAPAGEFERLVRISTGQGPMAMFSAVRPVLKPDPLGNSLIAAGVSSAMDRMGSLFGEMLGNTRESEQAGADERGLERLSLGGDVVSSTLILQGWRVPREDVAGDLSVEDLTDPTRSFAEGAAQAATVMPGMTEAMREAAANREFLDEVPVVRGVRATWDGGLWIQRRGEDPWDDDGPIDVFDARREYVGTLAPSAPGMPASFGPDGLVLYWETDDLDVPTIVVKRLPEEFR